MRSVDASMGTQTVKEAVSNGSVWCRMCSIHLPPESSEGAPAIDRPNPQSSVMCHAR
jgi:hypothetical protein